METSRGHVGVRPARGVRLIQEGGQVLAYPEPHRTPVLPSAWAPLSADQQDAVLRACDAAPDSVVIRLGSVWEPGSEYRVYRLANDQWGGLAIVSRFLTEPMDEGPSSSPAGNRRLLGLAWEELRAVNLALDFFNWDLEAHGQGWRLAATYTESAKRRLDNAARG